MGDQMVPFYFFKRPKRYNQEEFTIAMYGWNCFDMQQRAMGNSGSTVFWK